MQSTNPIFTRSEQFSHAAPQYGQQQQYGQQPYGAPQYGAPAPYEAPGQPTPGVMTIDDVITKTAIIFGIARVAGMSRRQALGLGMLLSQGGEFGFVLFGQAQAAQLIAPEAAQAVSWLRA